MAPPKDSPVWKDFEKIPDDPSHVKCKICSKILSFNGSSTGAMLNHLRLVHKKYLESKTPGPDRKQQSLFDTGITIGRPCNSNRQNLITQMVADVITESNLPFSFVEGVAYRKLINFLEPNYKNIVSETVKNVILQKAAAIKEKVQQEINNSSAIALTTDAWTSCANDGFLSVTASIIDSKWEFFTPTLETFHLEDRHTTEYLVSSLENIMDSWNMTSKVIAVVHDNAANIAHVGNKISPNIEDIGCAAHTIHLAVMEAMGLKTQVTTHVLGRTINACSRLVGHFNHSNVANLQLQKRCNTMMPESSAQKLIQYCRTRWNSIHDMLERLDHLRWPVVAVLSDSNITKKSDAQTLELKSEQWNIIAALHPILQSIKCASTLLCSESNTSLSILLPVIYGLIQKLVNKDDIAVIETFKRDLTQSLETRFHLESLDMATSIAALSTVFDPRYKKLKFFTAEFRSAAYTKVRALCDNQKDDSQSSPRRKKICLESAAASHLFLDSDSDEDQNKSELDSYLGERKLSQNECPLKWWKENEKHYPMLSILAKRYLCVPATSAASERQFSAAGNIVTKKRARLLPGTTQEILFVHQNSKLFNDDCAGN